MTALKPGTVIRLPVGSSITDGNPDELHTSPTRIRKERIGVVEYTGHRSDYFVFTDRRGHPAALVDEAEVVTTDDHTLHVTKFNRGGYPIAGWNWPMWGYKYRCNCGHDCGQDGVGREEHAAHLRDLAG